MMGGHRDYTEEDICQVDLYVKSRLVTDTLDLVRKSRDTVTETDEFRSLTKIHPATSEDESIYSLIRDLRTIFYSLCSIRDKSQISSTQFEKLLPKQVIKSHGLMKIDLTLAFQNGAQGARSINFI